MHDGMGGGPWEPRRALGSLTSLRREKCQEPRVSQNQEVLSWALGASLVAQMVKNPSATWETWVRSLGWEDPLEKGTTTHFSILTWRIPVDRGAWQAIVHGVAKTQI